MFSTQREREYDQYTDLPPRESTQVRRGGRDGRREPDSGLGYTQDYRTRWTHDDWVDPDSFIQRTEQPAGRKRGAGGRPAVDRIPEETGANRDSRWDIPRKRALFTSDEPDSTTSGSDIPEGHADRPPEVGYSDKPISRRPQDEGRTEGRCSPNMELEMAVIRLQKDFDDCRTEFELARKHTQAVALRPPRRSGFTKTPVPRYSGKSNWEQYREVFEAIVCSNGWDDVTAALQLLSHLAEYNCQFQRVVRRLGDEPSIFAIELETLARRAFIDIDISIQLQMVRDQFIDGQVECALRRHLDSLEPDTPMSDIVDCCRVWISHCEVEIQPRMSTDRRPAHAICQVTEVELAPATSTETETVEDIRATRASRWETPTDPGGGVGHPDQ